MSEYNVTLCDICAPGRITRLDRGFALVDPEYALAKLGWEEQEVGHVCPVCLAEQKERAARDAAEEAESSNGVAITLEEGLAEIDANEAKLMSAETEAKVRAAIAERGLSTTYDAWKAEIQAEYDAKRASLRKSFGQA